MAVVWVFVLALRYFPVEFSLESIYMSLIPPLAGVCFVALSFIGFRLKYGRNYTYGIVERVHGRMAAVRVGYDICSNVKAGIYLVENLVGAKKGNAVKLNVDRPMLGLRGSKVKAILEKAGTRV